MPKTGTIGKILLVNIYSYLFVYLSMYLKEYMKRLKEITQTTLVNNNHQPNTINIYTLHKKLKSKHLEKY